MNPTPLNIVFSVIVIAIVLYAALSPFFSKKTMRTSKEFERLAKEHGHTPYTRQELAEMQAEDYRVALKNRQAAEIWALADFPTMSGKEEEEPKG